MPEAHQPAAAQLFFGLDFGLRRIGIASGDTITRRARPLATVESARGSPDWPRLRQLVKRWQPRKWIVGLPLTDSGGENAATARIRTFAVELERETQIPVCFVDERYSSLDAAAQLKERREAGTRRRRVAKGDVDGVAAAVILERWLSSARAPSCPVGIGIRSGTS